MKRLISGIVMGATLALTSQAFAISMPLSEYNLIVEEDYEHLGGSVWGKTFIGGDIIGYASEFAVQVPESPVVDSLKVVGDIKASHVKVKSGNLVIGGEIAPSSMVELHGAGASIIHDNTLSIDSVIGDLNAASAYYQSLATNTSYSNGVFSYSGSDDVAVFSGSVDDIFLQNTGFNFTGVNAGTIIINVSGTSIAPPNSYGFPAFDKEGLNGLGAANILWNFYEAEQLDLGSPNFMGTVLAMNAHANLMGTLEGSLAVKSLTTQRQIHDYTFTPPVNPVPVPGSALLFGSALAGMGALMRRRKAKKA